MNRKVRFYTWVSFTMMLCLLFAGCKKQTEVTDKKEKVENTVENYTELTDKELEVLAYDNDVKAQVELANRYDYGTAEVGQDIEAATEWYEKAAMLGSAESMCALGYEKLNGIGAESDLDGAVEWFTKAVLAGYSDANVGIARAYLGGYQGADLIDESVLNQIDVWKLQYATPDSEGVEDDLDYGMVAYYFIEKADSEKSVLANYYKGYCLENGIGIPKNVENAIACYEEVISVKELSVYDNYLPDAARTRLAKIYISAEGVDQDVSKAIDYLEEAKDYEVAQYYLGTLYENGTVVDKDYEKALECYEKAAESDYAPALNQIGYLYYNGFGVDADVEQTIYYQKLAAMQGYAPAQINLGYLYENGIGVEQNYETSLAYYQLALDQEYEGAKDAVFRVRSLMDER